MSSVNRVQGSASHQVDEPATKSQEGKLTRRGSTIGNVTTALGQLMRRPSSPPVAGGPTIRLKSPFRTGSPFTRSDSPRLTISDKQRFPDGSERGDTLEASPQDAESSTFHLPNNQNVIGNAYSVPTPRVPDGDPHTDAHFHPTNYVQRGLTPRQVVNRMRELGLRYSTWMPIPTSFLAVNKDHNGNSMLSISHELMAKHTSIDWSDPTEISHHCGSLNHYYVPEDLKDVTLEQIEANPKLIAEIVKSGELYVDRSVDERTAHDLRNSGLSQAERSQLDPMITGIHLGDPRAGEHLLRTLFNSKGIFTGIGEITIHKELVQNLFAGQGQPHIQKNIEAFKDLAELAGVVGMPIVLHCDAYDLHDQISPGNRKGETPVGPSQMDGLEALFRDPKLKDTKIIWAHAGGLGRFVSEEPGHTDRLQRMLKNNPNLHLDISWSRVASQLTTPQAKERWAKFIVRNQTRILFGSDALAPSDNKIWGETKEMYRELFDSLGPIFLHMIRENEKINPTGPNKTPRNYPDSMASELGKAAKNSLLNDNYERVIVNSRDKVREFEQKVLTTDFYNNSLVDTDLKDSQGQPLMENGERAKRVTAEHLRQELARVEGDNSVDSRVNYLKADKTGGISRLSLG